MKTTKNQIKYYSEYENRINEEDGGGDSGATTSDASNGGVAYANNGNVSGMGAIKNATVSPIPGDPKGSEAGSGDVGIPFNTYTKNAGGMTGNKFTKMDKMKVDTKFMARVNKIKDTLGVGKVKDFKSFLNN